MKRLVAVIATVLVIAGCQSPEPIHQTSQLLSETQAEDPFFAPQTEEAVASLRTELIVQCKADLLGYHFEECYRKRLAEAFRTPQAGTDACATLPMLIDYVTCVEIGTIAYQIRQQIVPAQQPEMTVSDWRSPNAYMPTVLAVALQDIYRSCGVDGVRQSDNCVRNNINRLANLPESFLGTCNDNVDKTAFGRCIGEAIVVDALQQAADRVRNRSIL